MQSPGFESDDPTTRRAQGLARLRALLRDMQRALIAYSGGVDSAFLLRIAADELGSEACALTAISPSYPTEELVEARALAEQIGVRMIEVNTNELDRPGYRANAGDRCYHCKTELFEVAAEAAESLDLGVLCYGAIPDDLGDHRPGMQAAKELSVRAPLIEAGLSKADIRALSRELGLPTWNKPASACLSSRFPYGTAIDAGLLEQVGRCEVGLHQLGLRQVRARYHGDLVRVEIAPDELEAVFADPALRAAVIEAGKAAGFKFVAVDLQGYRTGSTNEALVQLIDPARPSV
ncbi:MAG: hypothetical protein ACI9U2_000469 [Bradymonadia bacterium]